MASQTIPSDILSALPGFEGSADSDLEALASVTEERELRRGDVLVRQGDPADALYFVLSGRLGVYVRGVVEPIDEIGQGQPVGEMGFFAGVARTATVVALRDSRLLAITREQFRKVSAACPNIPGTVITSLARRLSASSQTAAGMATPVRTVAILSAGGSSPSYDFIELLRRACEGGSRAIFLTQKEVSARGQGRALDHPATSAWLNALEAEVDLVFYVADRTLTDWTRKCIRQADVILLLAAAGASVDLNEVELFAFSIHPPSTRRLIMLHAARSGVVSGTASWLATRDVFMHHHVAVQDTKDLTRLLRFLSGKAVGFIASGGGALGSAHLGVYKAFCESGIEFDILGGTSVGAAMTAALAYSVDPERVDEGTHNIFVKSRSFSRYTLPRYGLLDHKVFDRALQVEYRDVLIEDLWTPFFAVSSNLSERRPQVHRRGPVWHAVRASGSVPGMLPPFFTERGEMLVDGGLMDNVPLAPMKALKAGPNVIVTLYVDERTTYPVDYATIPGLLELAAAALNPFARRRLPKVPSIAQVIMLSMVANRRTGAPFADSDILIKPEIPDGVRFTSWDRHEEVFQHAYHGTLLWIEARMAANDAQLSAMLAPNRPASATPRSILAPGTL
jgi:NTE family protein